MKPPGVKERAIVLFIYVSSLHGRTEPNKLNGNGRSLWIWRRVSSVSHSVLPLGKQGGGTAAVTVIAFVVGGDSH